MPTDRLVDRRGFLESVAASAALAAAAPAHAQPGPPPASEVTRVGVIGLGRWGRDHILGQRLLPNPAIEVAALCDVDRRALEQAEQAVLEQRGHRPAILADFRALCEHDDLAAVIVAAPDHWHALCTIAAMESGKHVFCEPPLANTAIEAQAVIEAQQLWKRSLQVNLAKRTDPRYRTACHNARFRRLGRVVRVEVTLAVAEPPVWSEPAAPPAGLDWNQWLGPAPLSDFSLSKLNGGFRWFSDYAAGPLTDGIELVDLAVWGVGLEQQPPSAVRVLERAYDPTSPMDVPRRFHVAFEFDGGLELHLRTADQDSLTFQGETGSIRVGAQEYVASAVELNEFFPQRNERAADYGDVWDSFWASLRLGRALLINAETCYRAVALVDLAHTALQLNRGFRLVEGTDQPTDEAARRLMIRPLRAPHYLLTRSVMPSNHNG